MIDKCQSLSVVYLISLILVELHIDLASTPNQIVGTLPNSVTGGTLEYAQAVDDVWKTYYEECHMKSLLRLCILCTRNSMHRVDDESFLCLPVPTYIRKLLTYRAVSERIFEQWRRGITVET